jgi:hypothetical protein
MQMIGVLESRSRPRTWDAAARAAIVKDAEDPGLKSEPFLEADAEEVRGAYDGAAAYADAWFGYLIAGLKERGLYNNLTVVVFSDHGEAMGEEGRFGHGEALDDSILHVPLMIHLPGAAPRNVSAQVALLDVLPTVLELAGAKPPSGMMGHSLLPWIQGAEGPTREVVFAEGTTRMMSARTAEGRLTFSGVSADSSYLPDLLKTSAIHGPAFERATTVPDSEREKLRTEMLQWRTTLQPSAHQEMDPKQVEQMRSHGYWDNNK